jgi:hypothetical protein
VLDQDVGFSPEILERGAWFQCLAGGIRQAARIGKFIHSDFKDNSSY